MKPITRIEHYLAAIAGLQDYTPEEPITRLEKYLAYINGKTDGYPEPVTRIDQLIVMQIEKTDLPFEPIRRLERILAGLCNEPVTREESFWLQAVEAMNSGIPKGYIPLEYLKSTGTQYIDLGITPSDDMEFEVTYQVTSGSGKLYGTEVSGLIFDAYGVTPTSGILRAFKHSNTGGTLTNITTVANEKVALKVVVKDGTYSTYVNGELVNTAPAVGTPPNATMYLFACNRNGKADALIKSITWGCVVKKSGKQVGVFRPFLTNEGEAGLYNTVDRSFHKNLGTGEFEYEYSVDSYVQDSLIMQLDGIKNTRSGHNAEATVWEDLIGNVNFTKTNYFSFGDNCILVNYRINSDNTIVVPDEFTMEVIYQYDGDSLHTIGFSGRFPFFKGRRDLERPWWLRATNDWRKGLHYTDSFGINATHSIALTQNSEGGKCYHNGILSASDSNVVTYSSEQSLKNSDSDKEVLTGKIFAIRLYKRSLTAEELAQNYKIDQSRFVLTETASVMMLGGEVISE